MNSEKLTLDAEERKHTNYQPSDYRLRKHKQKIPHVSPYWRFSSAFMLFQFILMMICIHSWTLMEGNHVMYITDGCRGEMLDTDTEKRDAIIADMILYLETFKKRKNYLGKYCFSHLIIIVTLLAIAAFYLYLFDWFVDPNEGGKYSPLQLIYWNKEDNTYRDDPLIKMFPRSMGCDIEFYGPSGSKQFKEFKCNSPYNDANEAIHVGAVLMFPVLAVAVFLNMIYTILCVTCLTTTCFENTRFKKAANPLNLNQRFLFLLVCKNVGYDVQTELLLKMNTDNKRRKKSPTESKEEKKLPVKG